MKEASKQMNHFLPLFGILAAGALGFFLFSFDRVFQAALTVATAVGYVSWGVIHHRIHKDLYPEVIIEYIAVAALGLVIIFSVIFRS